MKKKEALEAVTFLNSLSNTILDFILILWTVLVVTAGPVVSCSRIITNALAGLKNVTQFAV